MKEGETVMTPYPSDVLAHARAWAARDLYSFSALEERALGSFFTNFTRSVFFMHTLPQAVGDVLLAMYSRIKNPRGLRGVFVDHFLPQFLGTMVPEVEATYGGDTERFLKENNLTSLAKFVAHSSETADIFAKFLASFSVDPAFIERFSGSSKVRNFLSVFLDKYGHNSIARMAGGIWIGFEQISILAAKSIEWGRPGAGYIELSTRYVDMAGKGVYPIAEELASYGMAGDAVDALITNLFERYRILQGANFDGPFPQSLRERYGSRFGDVPKDLEAGIIGETCDVLGNFLPAATLTSVGVCVSGEALPGLVQHLMLDDTPENIALVGALIAEAACIGLDQFLRHLEITPWKAAGWEYLKIGEGAFEPIIPCGDDLYAGTTHALVMPSPALVERTLETAFGDQWGAKPFIGDILANLSRIKRGKFDKLPNQFELVSASFRGTMSFRGWRDLHRQGFCTHLRTYLTPELGFYRYDKPAPSGFFMLCASAHRDGARLYAEMQKQGIPPQLMQYPLALGNLIGFQIGANLSQWEFCNWQRTDYSVNHEVRQIFLGVENILRRSYRWWGDVSRADITRAYIFARGGTAIPLSLEEM